MLLYLFDSQGPLGAHQSRPGVSDFAGPPDRCSDSRNGRGLNSQESLDNRELRDGQGHESRRPGGPCRGPLDVPGLLRGLNRSLQPHKPEAPGSWFGSIGLLEVAAGSGQDQRRVRTHGSPQLPRVRLA